jgi:hypothetical protein
MPGGRWFQALMRKPATGAPLGFLMVILAENPVVAGGLVASSLQEEKRVTTMMVKSFAIDFMS